MWRLFRQYGVDLFLCGEVHANTVIVDPGGPTQITSKGFSKESWVMIVDVEIDALNISVVDSLFDTVGTVNIPKTGQVIGKGILSPIDMSRPLIHWVPEAISSGPVIKFVNRGEFAPYHASESGACLITDNQGYIPRQDEGCVFEDISPLFRNGYEGTVEVVFKASPYEGGVLVSVTRAKKQRRGVGLAVVQYHNRIEIYFNGATSVFMYDFIQGDTYTLRIVHETAGRLQDLAVYIDGKVINSSDESEGSPPLSLTGVPYRLATGGAFAGSEFFNQSDYEHFRSEIHSLKVWGRARPV